MSAEEIDSLKARRTRFSETLRCLHRRTGASWTANVILAKTKKGYGMRGAGESRNTYYQQKKLDIEALGISHAIQATAHRRRPCTAEFSEPADESPEIRYLQARRRRLAAVYRRAIDL